MPSLKVTPDDFTAPSQAQISLTPELLSKLPYRRGNDKDPRIIFIGTAPGNYEFADEQKRAFVGSAGKLLDNKLIKRAHIDQSECYFTNVLKEHVYKNKDAQWIKENPQAYLTYLRILSAELNLVAKSANVIVPLGDIALQAIMNRKGISNWRGSILSTGPNNPIIQNKKCIPALHPASILRNWSELVYTKLDFHRIREESHTPDINLPQRKYVIRPDFDTALMYLNKYINTDNKVSVDIETLKNIRPNRIVSIQFADSKDEGFCLPLQHKNNISWWSIKQEMQLWRLIYKILTTKQLIGQNFTVFDTFMLHFHGIPYQAILDHVYLDLLEAMRCMEPELPASLGFFTSVYTREPFYKEEGKGWGTKESEDEFFTYGCKDVCIPCEIAPQMEQDLKDENLWEFYKKHFIGFAKQRMSCSVNGLPINIKRREELSIEYAADIVKDQCKLTVLTGTNVNVKSNPQMKHLLYDVMKLPPQFDKDGHITTNEDALLKLSTKSESGIFPIILHQRHLRTLKSNTLDARLDSDNRIRTSFGWTETHRLTSSGVPFQTGTNLQNMDKKLRAIIVAPDGYVLGKGDESQAEARIVAWRGRMRKSIELFLDHTRDIHYETAAEVNSIKLDQVIKDIKLRYEKVTKEMRYSAKRIRYGVNYDMHASRFAKTYNKDAGKIGMPFITEKKAQFFIHRFHEIEPDLQRVYHAEIAAEVSKNMTLYNCFDARMRFHERVGDDLFRAAYSWYAQSTVAYLINMIWDLALDAGIWVVHQNHDELVWFSKKDEVEKDNETMLRLSKIPMDICGLKDVPPLVIPFEIENGPNWYDTKLWEGCKAA
jgi:uracil-DNA glycosylase family 4